MAKDARQTRRWREVIVPRVIKRDRGICHLCDRPGAETADHLVPYSLGGTHHYDNLKAAHLKCNRIRGNRSITVARNDIIRQLGTQQEQSTWEW